MANNPDIPSTEDVVNFVRNEVQYQMPDASEFDQKRIESAVSISGVERLIENYLDDLAIKLNIDY